MSPSEIRMLAQVFSEDPMFYYLFPPGEKQIARLELAMTFLMRLAKACGIIKTAGEAPDAIMAYYPPGKYPPSNARVLWEILRAIPYAIPRWIPINKISTNLKIMAQLEKKHPPEPHWYISIIAVNPAARGKGVGSRILEPLEAEADAAKQSLYLETTNPRNHSFYLKHGFVCVEEFQPFVGVPTVWRMLRRAR